PAVQQDDHRTIGRAVLGVSNIQDAGVDLFQRRECRTRRSRGGLRQRRTAEKQWSSRNADGGGVNELAAILADLFGHIPSRSWGCYRSKRLEPGLSRQALAI